MGRPYSDVQHHRDEDSDDDAGVTTQSDDDRIIYFAGEVSETNVSGAIAAIFAMAKKDPKSPIYLTLETYGGSQDSMFSLYDAIKFVPCPVHTVALGKVMSAGVLILAAGTKGQRKIAPHARVMTHPAWGAMVGNIFEIKHELQEMARQEDQWIEAMMRETGQDAKKIRELNSKTFDQYLTPQQAIEWGIADELLYDIEPKKPPQKGRRRQKA